MATKQEVKKWLDIIVERLNDIGPFVAKDWGGSVQFVFTDLNTGWLLKMKMDGTVESLKEKIEEGDACIVETDGATFIGIYEKTISPMDAYSAGTMKCKGSLDGLMKVLAPTVE